MSHQDWKEVVIYKPNSKKTKQTETVKRTQHNNVKEVDIAEGKTIQFVSTDLKKKLENVRLSIHNPETEKSITRDEFAKKINVQSKSIQLLETGKLTEKEAKQIALKAERVFKIKIL